MSMNLWECEYPLCKSTAIGVGGAAGLLAIGWQYEPGPMLLCPEHRKDEIPCDASDSQITGQPCSICRAQDTAEHWQNIINDHYGWPFWRRRRASRNG